MADKNYFYIEALESSGATIGITKYATGVSPIKAIVYYSLNEGSTWIQYTFGTDISLSIGQKCYWKGDNNSFSTNTSDYLKFYCSGSFLKAGGNIMSLVDSTCESVTIPNNYCFYRLFYTFTKLQNIDDLILPAITLTQSCYNSMFYSTAITSIPDNFLPATKMEKECYFQLFYSCKRLTYLNKNLLPATELADACYNIMFQNCTSLKNTPNLPATILTASCYSQMFQGCTSLVDLPELPATTMAKSCYFNLFKNCTSIKVSETKTDEYWKPYRIPSEGTGSEVSGWNSNMFTGTGGIFTGNPTINTTYYLAAPLPTFNYNINSDTHTIIDDSSTPSGEYEIDTKIIANAVSNKGYTFSGFYDASDTLVSSSNPYKFQITEDTTLVAKSEISYIDKVRLNEKEYNFRDVSLIQSNKINNVWYGTKEDYLALENYDDNIEYNILSGGEVTGGALLTVLGEELLTQNNEVLEGMF